MGIAIFSLLLPQWALGFIHHQQYPQKRRRTWITQSHRILGPAILITAVFNGGVGLQFADSTTNTLAIYTMVVSIVATIIGIMVILKARQTKTRAVQHTNSGSLRFGGVYGQGGRPYASDIALVPQKSSPIGNKGQVYAISYPKPGAF
jgi:lipoprotein signal peptidase